MSNPRTDARMWFCITNDGFCVACAVISFLSLLPFLFSFPNPSARPTHPSSNSTACVGAYPSATPPPLRHLPAAALHLARHHLAPPLAPHPRKPPPYRRSQRRAAGSPPRSRPTIPASNTDTSSRTWLPSSASLSEIGQILYNIPHWTSITYPMHAYARFFRVHFGLGRNRGFGRALNRGFERAFILKAHAQLQCIPGICRARLPVNEECE
ncbi:hypothetical protein C8J57DRAFT_1731987 [Mycena rebaudengoi]|nr:hypothetical protein C8J57DRAFT_1731987 [Mycena rebaudengoi]